MLSQQATPVYDTGSEASKEQTVESIETHVVDFELVPVMDYVISKMFQPDRKRIRLRFDSACKPNISLLDYLDRLNKYFFCSRECQVNALILIDRLKTFNTPKIIITEYNIHRLLLVAFVLAVKYFDDVYFSNAYYAKVGGIPMQELNSLELYFLHLINYELWISRREYELYRLGMERLNILLSNLSHEGSK